MGLAGGLAGALIGALVYFLIFKYTGLRIKLLAIGVGGLAGWSAEYFGKGEGSKELGGITAIFVIAGIVAAQYFVALGWWHDTLATDLDETPYAISVKQAKTAVAAIPTGSDDEIRNFLAKEGVDGESVDPKLISDSDIKQFRDNQLPQMQKLAGGQISKQEFDAANGVTAAQEQKEEDRDENTFKGVFLLLLLSKTNIVSLVVAAGAAFKLSANA